jgi:hypothetical protein
MSTELDMILKQTWLDQPVEPPRISLDVVKTASRQLQRRIGIRNFFEYVAAVVVVISYSQMMLKIQKPMVQIGCVLIVIATLYVVVQMHVRLSAQRAPADAFGASFLEFHRAAMLRQIAGLETVMYWYVLPLAPGFSLLVTQEILDGKWANAAALSAMFLVIALGAVALNRFAARRMRRKLAEFDALIPGSELDHRTAA